MFAWKSISKGTNNGSLRSDIIIYNSKPVSTSVSVEITNAVSASDSMKLVSLITVEGTPEISSFGTTFIPLWLFETGGTNSATVEYDNSIYNVKNGQTYGATLSDVPEQAKDMLIVGKSFIKNADGSYTWSAAKCASVNDTSLQELE